MLFVLTLGILLGVAGLTLLHQWLTGALAEVQERVVEELEPIAFPRLAPPRRMGPARRAVEMAHRPYRAA